MLRRCLLIKLLFIFLSTCLFVSCEVNNNDLNDSVTFTDNLGREVRVQKNPERVAVLIGGLAEVWVLSGGNLCAAPQEAWDDYGLSADGAVNLGGAHSPGVEALLSSNPDFVIAGASSASNAELKDVLESAGITVAYFDVDSFDDYLSMLDICTDITGRKDLYEKNGVSVQQTIEQIKAEYSKNVPETEKMSVLLLRVSSGTVKTKGSNGTVLGEMLSELGCINIADNDKTLLENLSVESVIKQNPYRVFAVVMGDDYDATMAGFEDMLMNNPIWSTLPAIQNDRLHIMDRELFHLKPNEKWAESYEKLSRILLENDE